VIYGIERGVEAKLAANRQSMSDLQRGRATMAREQAAPPSGSRRRAT
jgi:hypothetical protein